MRAGAEAKTSLLTAGTFEEALRPVLEEGRDVLLFTISSGISGTYAQAKEAADNLMKEYPGRKVYALDSANASLGEGLIAHLMALQDMGADQDAFAFEDLLGDGSGGDQRRGDPAAEMPAAPEILIAEVFFISGIIRM